MVLYSEQIGNQLDTELVGGVLETVSLYKYLSVATYTSKGHIIFPILNLLVSCVTFSLV
jgi:hypothetical protein